MEGDIEKKPHSDREGDRGEVVTRVSPVTAIKRGGDGRYTPVRVKQPVDAGILKRDAWGSLTIRSGAEMLQRQRWSYG